jgi:5'-deoxynucleotidase YfbR-like HD superfamily hydrolase
MPKTAIETEPMGLIFDFMKPRAESVALEDVARALSNTCRFGGHVKRYYSVAEHAVLVYELVAEAGATPAVCFAALHHDSHEAYMGDIPTPFKRLLRAVWPRIQDRVDAAVCERLGVDPDLLKHAAVKKADARALLIEANELKSSKGVGSQWSNAKPVAGPPWSAYGHGPEKAEANFLITHYQAKEACQ